MKNALISSVIKNIYPTNTLRSLKVTCLAVFIPLLLATTALAQTQQNMPSIRILGIMGSKVSVSVNGSTPKVISVGEEIQGVKLLSAQGQEATFQLPPGSSSHKMTLRVGQAAYTVQTAQISERNDASHNAQASATGPESAQYGDIVFERKNNNHFYATATIGQKNVSFMVDTGASLVVLSAQDAQTLGMDWRDLPYHISMTANGPVRSYDITIPAITIQGVTLYNIKGAITPTNAGISLLGQSYLRYFRVMIKNNQMILKPR